MDNIPDQGDEELNRILREIIEEDKRDEEKPKPRRTRAHSVGNIPEWGQYCRKHDGPPCWPLIGDAAAILSDRARWPTHICPATVKESLMIWTRDTPALTKSFDGRALYQSAIPMPIGKRSLVAWASDPRLKTFGLTLVFGDQPPQPYANDMWQMPFDGDEYAALILTTQIKDATVTMFGLQEESGGVYRVAGMQFDTRSPDADSNEMRRLKRNAREWWNRFRGVPVTEIKHGGRPAKLPDDPTWVYQAYADYEEEADNQGWTSIPVKHFVEFVAPRFAGLTTRTFRTYMRAKGIPWPPVRPA